MGPHLTAPGGLLEGWLDPSPVLADGLAFSEQLVARLWAEQRHLPSPLITTEGEELRVIYPGRRRWDRGPDFTGAILARPDASLLQGAVEVHLYSSDWRAHGHHRDAHYNPVILHLVLWDDSRIPTVRQDGVPVPLVALAGQLALPLAVLVDLPPPLVPYPPPCWPGGQDDGLLGGLLDQLGMERFQGKEEGFRSRMGVDSPEQLAYEGIADALGYSQNREPFRRLAQEAPLAMMLGIRAQHRSETGGQTTGGSEEERLALEAALLGVAGLFPSQRGLDLQGLDPYAVELERLWSAHPIPGAFGRNRPLPWQFFRVRPANFPTRRVAALAGLVSRWPEEGLLPGLAALIASQGNPRRVPAALESTVAGGGEGYWKHQWDFGLPLPRPRALVGRQRAAEVVVNVLLPLLAALPPRDGAEELRRRARAVYAAYPRRGDNEITRHMGLQLVGSARPSQARSARRQQGLLGLYRTWCEARRCGLCPVASFSTDRPQGSSGPEPTSSPV